MTLLTTTNVAPFAVALTPPTASPAVIKLPGTTILHAPHAAGASADAALTSLRGLKGARRRLVWCNSTTLVRAACDWRSWGQKLVDEGGADMVVVSGAGAREIALAARDAGLPLGRVVVCRDEATARNVLGDSITRGDAVLALSIDAESCQRLADRLESKFERDLTVH